MLPCRMKILYAHVEFVILPLDQLVAYLANCVRTAFVLLTYLFTANMQHLVRTWSLILRLNGGIVPPHQDIVFAYAYIIT
jgi:hypothetical protein